ncbi:MAG: citrate synthase [Polyangiaceae bacterium]
MEGVIVTKTRASLVDGAAGRLVVAGEDVEALAERATFEEAAAQLFRSVGDPSPIHSDAAALRRAISEGRALAFATLPGAAASLAQGDAMDALRGAMAALPAAFAAEPAHLIGAAAVFVAAHARTRNGLTPIAPDPSRGHAADFLAMLGAEKAAPGESDARARALGAYLVTVMDHGLNASTFAARVVASTGSDLVSSVVAAIGALKGPLHGGAPGPVLDMRDAIGAPERAEEWLDAELASGRRIMGTGHRVYRVRDPRALVLERATTALEAAGIRTGRLALARAVEHAAEGALKRRHPERSLAANVEFYTAVLLDAVGIPRTHFAATFAVGRVAGWCAHVFEQRATGRLIRPDALYVGERPASVVA